MSKTFPGLGYNRRAYFSQDRKCRFSLTATFAEKGFLDLWCMMNPSAACEKMDDPTVRRSFLRSIRDGAREATIVNTLPYMATDPKDCMRWLKDENRPDTDVIKNYDAIRGAALMADRIILAWGNPFHEISGKVVLSILDQPLIRRKVYYLRKTKIGAPSHPLYLPDSLELKRWFE